MHIPLRKFLWSAKIYVEDDKFCNNTAATQPPTLKIQVVRLQNHYAETLWNKQNVTSQVQLDVPHGA